MSYTGLQRELSDNFRRMPGDGMIPGTRIKVVTETFRSRNGYNLPVRTPANGIFSGFFSGEDLAETNNNFQYRIFLPENPAKGYIILLHGLNERSWDKYLMWALRMASDTGKPVILFPIAYHMNRSPLSWFDRHAMMPAVAARLISEPATRMASFVNVALSVRMSMTPQRFFLSGSQAVNDIAFLLETIRSGHHPHISTDAAPDIFAYSIGAMITQVLMLSKDELLPDESRIILFCGGSVLNMMDGTSKMIMDSRAFDRLINFYIDEIDDRIKHGGDWFTRQLEQTFVGEAFYAMSSMKRLDEVYKDPFSKNSGRIKAISFKSDTVIPASAVSATMHGADVEIWTPEYPNSHENPFPILNGDLSVKVDNTFDRLFDTTALFFS